MWKLQKRGLEIKRRQQREVPIAAVSCMVVTEVTSFQGSGLGNWPRPMTRPSDIIITILGNNDRGQCTTLTDGVRLPIV